MSTFQPPAYIPTRVGAPSRAGRLQRTIHAEWTKLRSLRSNRIALLSAFVATVVIGGAASAATANGWDKASASQRAAFDPVAVGLTGGALAQLIVGVVGVLLLTAEFSSGTIRGTFAAVPARRTVLAAKAVVVSGAVFLASLASAVGSFVVSQRVLAGKHLDVSWTDPGVARAVIGGALYLTVAALLGLGIASLLRNTAAAIATLIAVLLVIPSIVGLLPGALPHDIGRYVPSIAGSAVIKVNPEAWEMAPWTGLGLFAGYAAATLAIGAWVLRRRDV